jgi:hypothetical protein
VNGLENYQQLFEKLGTNGAIKVFMQVAPV